MSNSLKQFRRLRAPAPLMVRYLPWRRATFAAVAAASDVSVLPVEVNPFTRGKTSNRVATALGAGMTVVTDRLPSYLDYDGCVLFDAPGAGVLAYLRDPELRARHIAAGQSCNGEIYDPGVVE